MREPVLGDAATIGLEGHLGREAGRLDKRVGNLGDQRGVDRYGEAIMDVTLELFAKDLRDREGGLVVAASERGR